MNIPADMLYYTAPIDTPFGNNSQTADTGEPQRLLVTGVHYERNRSMIGSIVEIRSSLYRTNGRVWRVSADGTYVTGHLLNTEQGTYDSLVGLTPTMPDGFVVGVSRSHGGHKWRILDSIYAFNAADRVGPIADNRRTLPVSTWMPAAPWAMELMPGHHDSEEVRAAKVSLAKERWELNRAAVYIEVEGYERGWTADLNGLRSDEALNFLPQIRYGALVNGSMLIPLPTDAVSEESADANTKAAIEAVRTRSLGTLPTTLNARPKLQVPAEFYVHTTYPRETVGTMETDTVQSFARNALGLRGTTAEVGPYTVTPIPSYLSTPA